MICVVSHAWLRPGPEPSRTDTLTDHLRAYCEISASFDAVHHESGGYQGRRLMHSLDEPGHLINLRWFDQRADYHRLTSHPDYASWIGRLSEHVLARDPMKEFFDVALDSLPVTGHPITAESLSGSGSEANAGKRVSS